MPCLQAFTHVHSTKLLSSGGLLAQCAPCQPRLAGSCEKFIRVFELNVADMVDVGNIVNGDPLELIGGKSGAFRLFQRQLPYLLRWRVKERQNEPSGLLDYFGTNPSHIFGRWANGREMIPSSLAFRLLWGRPLTPFWAMGKRSWNEPLGTGF
jgi:hypothetical protein